MRMRITTAPRARARPRPLWDAQNQPGSRCPSRSTTPSTSASLSAHAGRTCTLDAARLRRHRLRRSAGLAVFCFKLMRHCDACEWRTTLVTASRSPRASARSSSAPRAHGAMSSVRSRCAAARVLRADISSSSSARRGSHGSPDGLLPARCARCSRRLESRRPPICGIAIGQLRRQLGLENDDRKCMSEQIVHVAGDPLTLGNFRELFRPFMLFDQRLIFAAHFTEVDVRAAHEHGDDRCRNPERRRQIERPRVHADDGEDDEHPSRTDGRPSYLPQERGGVDEETARAWISRARDQADCDNAEHIR